MPASSARMVNLETAHPCGPSGEKGDGFAEALSALRGELCRAARALTSQPADAEDLAQEALVKALSCRRQFRPGTDLRAWAKSILRNHFVDLCRRPPVVLVSDMSVPVAPVQLPEEDVLDLFTDTDVAQGLAALRASDREIIELATFESQSYQQISQRLALNPRTVGTRLFRARAKLRRELLRRLGRRDHSPPTLIRAAHLFRQSAGRDGPSKGP